MKLSAKLPLASAALLLMVAAAAMYGIQRLNHSLSIYETSVNTALANRSAVRTLSLKFKLQVQEWKDTLLRGKDAALLEKHWTAFVKDEQEVAEGARQLVATLPDDESKALLQKFAADHATMGAHYRDALKAFKAAGFDPVVGDVAVRGVDRESVTTLDKAALAIVAQASSLSDHASATGKRATTLSIVLMLIVVSIGLVISVLFSRHVLKPLAQAIRSAHAVADGDLTLQIHSVVRDEIGDLLRGMEKMRLNLQRVVGSVRLNAESVATASAQIAQGNHDLSQRTEEQAGALQQTAQTMDELGSTVRHTADSAQQANRLALDAADLATRGGSLVGEVYSTMNAINDRSKRVSDIIGLIDGIAFQTNILALNAAVEAARAGEQGRGFAVVATEVRSLAQRSADAAKEIKDLIGGSVDQVDRGTELVGRAGRAMDEIVEAIRRVSGIVGEISTATNEQSAGVGQIGQALSQMDQVTQQNAALVEESAAAAESLSVQAGHLVQAVAVFQL